jgi:hypothetical protein
MKVKFSICLPWRHLRGGGTAPLFHKFCIAWGEYSALPLDSLVSSSCGMNITNKKNNLAPAGNWATFPRSFVLWSQYRLCYTVRFVVTVPTILHRSSCARNTDYAISFVFWSQCRLCYTTHLVFAVPTILYSSCFGHNTDYVIPLVLWSQYRLCYTVRLVVTILSMLYCSSCGHSTVYAISLVLWSQYRLCYIARLVVTIPTMLYRSSCGHNTDYATPFVFWSQYRLWYTDPMFYCPSEKYENCKKSVDYSFKFCNVIRFGVSKRTSWQFISYQWRHSPHCVAAIDMVTNTRVAKDVERSDRSLIFVQCRYFPEGRAKNHDEFLARQAVGLLNKLWK